MDTTGTEFAAYLEELRPRDGSSLDALIGKAIAIADRPSSDPRLQCFRAALILLASPIPEWLKRRLLESIQAMGETPTENPSGT